MAEEVTGGKDKDAPAEPMLPELFVGEPVEVDGRHIDMTVSADGFGGG